MPISAIAQHFYKLALTQGYDKTIKLTEVADDGTARSPSVEQFIEELAEQRDYEALDALANLKKILERENIDSTEFFELPEGYVKVFSRIQEHGFGFAYNSANKNQLYYDGIAITANDWLRINPEDGQTLIIN